MPASPTQLPLTVITHEFFPTRGGIATFVEEISRACHELGQSVEVWAPKTPIPVDHHFPFPVHRVGLKGTQDLACQFRMARELIAKRRTLRRGMVYLPEPGPLLAMTYLQFFKAFKPVRLFLTFHGSELHRFSSRRGSRVLVNRLIKEADRVSTPSSYSHNLLCDRFPAAEGKAVITPGAVKKNLLSRRTDPVKSGGKIVILTVGRLHPRKGQEHILDALDALPDDLQNTVEYWIVGRCNRGNYEAHLRKRASESRVSVSFLGNIDDDDLETIYRRADIFAMTSVNHGDSVEGFGLAYLEASAFGLPVVGNAVGGVSDAVKHNETGLLVAPHDRAALTDALSRLIREKELRKRLGQNGHSWAREHSWQDSAQILLDGFIPPGAKRPLKNPALQPA
jgi:glycosyltransferase involved in cell wall biosynthesis